MNLRPLSPARLARAKVAYTTRHVPLSGLTRLVDDVPRIGDLVLAQVRDIGQHARIELANGRRSTLFSGDEVVVCIGARYAPDQFEADVPDDLGPCELVAAGGLAARVRSRHEKMAAATTLETIGLLAGADGRPANLAAWSLEPVALPTLAGERPPVLAVVGTSMNAGKTTSAAALIRGLVQAGARPAAAKVTGTGAGGDIWLLGDAGASPVLDFTAAGLPSTYKAGKAEIERVFTTLTSNLLATGADAIVLEVADGLCQEETAALVSSSLFAATVDAVVFAAGDALGADAGVQWLRDRGAPVVAVSGLLSCSPMASREAAELTGLPVLDLAAMGDGVQVRALTTRPAPRGRQLTFVAA